MGRHSLFLDERLTRKMYQLNNEQTKIYLKYASLGLPRHTSYPIAPVWQNDMKSSTFCEEIEKEIETGKHFSLYIHIPFCRSLCYYCGCTKEIIDDKKRAAADPADHYLDMLAGELQLLEPLVSKAHFEEIHFGGGTPTFLTPNQLLRLNTSIKQHIDTGSLKSWAVEVDPRTTTNDHLRTLKEMGVTRLSLGVQDFNEKVQKAVNRIQPFSMVKKLVESIRTFGFQAINFDLIYGLPFQTEATVNETVEQVVSLSPDRIAFYRLAMIPNMFRWQRSFVREDLPEGEITLNMNLNAIKKLTDAGYQFIGLDHFAKPDEQLAKAYREGRLQRNFQGMTTGKNLSLIGIGPSAISQLDKIYKQNPKTVKEWHQAIDQGLKTTKGLQLSVEDRLRRAVLQSLYGYGKIDKAKIAKEFSIEFNQHFANELKAMEELQKEGLVDLSDPLEIRLTDGLGQLLMRVVASVFDAYLPSDAYKKGLDPGKSSKVG